MKIKKVKYFTFLLVSFLMTKIFCNSPIEISESNYSFELKNKKIIKVFIFLMPCLSERFHLTFALRVKQSI